MTDMRATERLLEVIEDSLPSIEAHMAGSNGIPDAFIAVAIAIKELRRRGDTLVRAADLRVVLSVITVESEYTDRLENALGGRMR